ncbi:high-potential iron-sulfur protein [Cupriavidus sp. D39]|uniref:high-potential iron-sulfur protein n=1 Tax=Cupriavidus sp. D39 TaxID=2997877 RepID=UPI00226F5B44|nr:high-potential iron-sulfur protein [Cupriavidus sp. D39]MCY0853258.1 high-potential iron-sulfur protein [Cupriavidus sp. D39]
MKLDEIDPQAVSLGYKHDTTTVNKTKFSQDEVSQKCSNCQCLQLCVGTLPHLRW